MTRRARLIAYYLPQYHPIPENDRWWGKGFTEWTNVTKAKPLFRGHKQPRFPADLGYYDLRVPEVREAQADLAREYGIEGFCYYHYWFGDGKQLLERPFKEVLATGKPDFPFCLCWANETWKGIWFGGHESNVLIEQSYPGRQDHQRHFEHLRPAFEDKRYIRVEGKPFFQVYMPMSVPNLKELTDTFREEAHKAGLEGIFLVASRVPWDWDPQDHDFDAVIGSEHNTMRYYTAKYFENNGFWKNLRTKVLWKLGVRPNADLEVRKKPIVVEYAEAIKYLLPEKPFSFDYFPTVIPNWDNTPRSGNKGLVFKNSTPDLWKVHLGQAIDSVTHLQPEHRIVMIKSWNEWAESNYLEPDTIYGLQYLEVVQEVSFNSSDIWNK